ncbi:MAG TPA: type II secretion system protein [Gammaproteobacteria bacterium]
MLPRLLTRRKKSRGFTLVEMITVIVLLGIVAGMLTPFILSAMQAYVASKARAQLVGKGRLAIERLSREVRQAVPNSLSVLGGGTGIEFARARAGGRYVERFEDFGTEFSRMNYRFRKNANLANLYTTYAENADGSRLSFSANDVLVIGNTSPAILQAGTSAVALTGIANTDAIADGTANGQILTFGGHQFLVESPGKHFSIVDQTIEVGLVGSDLRWHTGNGLTGYNGAVNYGAGDPALVDGAGLTFTYSPGTPQSTGVLRVDLQLTDVTSSETIRLYHEIHVRNTP